MNLPVLPMGTVMALVMLVGAIATATLPFGRSRAARGASYAFAVLLAAAGAWQVLWYGVRHPGETWGTAALLTGVAMFAAATLLVRSATATAPMPPPPAAGADAEASASARSAPWHLAVAVALAAGALVYGVAIYRL